MKVVGGFKLPAARVSTTGSTVQEVVMQAQAHEESPARRRAGWQFRFRLASLLWLMLCIALMIGAYQWGVEAGRRDAWRTRTAVGPQYVTVYYVADLAKITTTPAGAVVDFDPLLREIQANVYPNTWIDAGGAASVSAFPTNLSLVVSHDKNGQAEVAQFLERKRQAAGLDGSGKYGGTGPVVPKAMPSQQAKKTDRD